MLISDSPVPPRLVSCFGSDDAICFPLPNVCNQSSADDQGSSLGDRFRFDTRPAAPGQLRPVMHVMKKAPTLPSSPGNYDALQCISTSQGYDA
jgi:hypothetical protein